MKKGIIINHNSNYISQVINLFNNCELLNYVDFDENIVDNYDFVVLSGGPIDISGYNDIRQEKNWIKKTNKPIFGICLGFQILCLTYDKNINYKNFEKNRRIDQDFNFNGFSYKMHYDHSYYFDQIPSGFKGAIEDNILTYIIHEKKPVIAFQGHPEMTDNGHLLKKFFLEKYLN